MRDFIAKISQTALNVLAIFSASAAEKVTFEANSPLTVAVGEPFRVEFALNAQPEPGSFKAPSFEGFDVIERFDFQTFSGLRRICRIQLDGRSLAGECQKIIALRQR